MKKIFRIFLVIIIILGGLFALIRNPQWNISQKILGLPGLEKILVGPLNPATIFCEQNGGEIIMMVDVRDIPPNVSVEVTGNKMNEVCHTPKFYCDVWPYFRGECAYPIADTGQNGIPDLTNCISYFDGCNNCSVKDGKPDACTKMYCETPAEPRCLQYATGVDNTGVVENQSGEIIYKEVSTEKYTVKVEQGENIAGENIYLYDKSGKKVFSLLAKNGDLQGVYLITGDYLIVDVGSDLMRELRVYNIVTKQQIFTSTYATEPLFPEDQKGKGYELHVEGNKVSFSTLVYDMYNNRQIPQPKTTPTCPTKRTSSTIGYSELRIFNLDTKQVEKTGKVICTFLQ